MALWDERLCRSWRWHVLTHWHLSVSIMPTLVCAAAGLRHLDLEGNSFTRVPAAISAATGLTSLALSWNGQLGLCEAGTETLLALRHLQNLQLMLIKSADPALLRRLPPSIRHKCAATG